MRMHNHIHIHTQSARQRRDWLASWSPRRRLIPRWSWVPTEALVHFRKLKDGRCAPGFLLAGVITVPVAYACTHVQMCVYTYVFIYTYIHIYIYMYIHIYIYSYVCILCVYIYIYTHVFKTLSNVVLHILKSRLKSLKPG